MKDAKRPAQTAPPAARKAEAGKPTTIGVMKIVWGIVVLGSLALGGCLGDPTREVQVRNRTGQTVVEYSYGRRDPKYKEVLELDQTLTQTWMSPISWTDPTKRRVEADDLAGTRIFCLDVGYDDLQRLNWRIDIVAGHPNCD